MSVDTRMEGKEVNVNESTRAASVEVCIRVTICGLVGVEFSPLVVVSKHIALVVLS